MARVLVYTSPARGHLFPIMPVMRELMARGHELSVRTIGSQVEMLRSTGLDAEQIDPAIEAIELGDHRARSPLGAQKLAMRAFAARGAIETGDLRRAIEETRPDALLVDINCWGAAIEAQVWGGPWAAWCPYPLPLPSRDAPPFGPGLTPALGPAGRLRDRLLRPLVFGALVRILLPRVNELRASAGLPPYRAASDLFTAPERLIYMTAEPFEYPRSDWPENVRLVGPCDWDPPAERPAWLDDITDPIVLVTTSSEYQADERLVGTALAALADRQMHVVATVPSGDRSRLDVPRNATVETFIPHGLVLKRAVCAVTHGGMGATQKALAHGVPVCAVPFGRDQLEVARRVEVAGAGVRLSARRLDAERLRGAVTAATERRAGARAVAESFVRAGGAEAAADALTEMLG